MTSKLPIIALDIDGVFSPVLKDEDFDSENYYRWDLNNLVWPMNDSSESLMLKTNCMEAYVAKPVADFIREVHETSRAKVMWHSTWGEVF